MTRPFPQLLVLSLICIIALLSSRSPVSAAIGVYNFTAGATSGTLPISIDYRLNCPGEVTIEIRDNDDHPVNTLGPFTETAGLHSHEWDGAGAPNGTGTYRARITATHSDTGTPGVLNRLCGGTSTASIYGLAVDRFPDSPGYGTIYVSQVGARGTLRAYNADGSPKDWLAGNRDGNALNLGFNTAPQSSPWGIGVDRLGNIYVACSTGIVNSGVKVFDHLGNELHHVFDTQPQGIFWLDGLAGPQGLEVYEALSDYVRACIVGDTTWHTAIGPISSTTVRQICFDPSGAACYLATSGSSSDPQRPNPGVTRYARQPGGEWAEDASFDCGLSGIVSGSMSAAYYATGVSCTATSLWMGLNCGNLQFGGNGNIARKLLPNGQTTLFIGPGLTKARFVAADSVGNVAVDGGYNSTDLWSNWALYAPAGETTSDTRLTNWVSIAGAAQRKVVNRIRDMKQEPPDSPVQLSSGRCVTAVFADCFYIEEDDRSSGVRVKCATPVSEGSYVKVGGTMSSEQGERYLADAEIIAP